MTPGTTTGSIARAAGVTQPLIHHHFGSKDGLWRAAVDAVFANVPRLVPTADGSPPRERLVDLVERFVRFVAAHPEVTRIIAREGAAPSPRLDYLLRRYEPFRGAVDLLRSAQNAGIVNPDIRAELALFFVTGRREPPLRRERARGAQPGIDTTAPWTCEAFVALMRTVLDQGLLRRTP